MNNRNWWMSIFPVVLMLVALVAAVGWFAEGLYHKDSTLMTVKSQMLDIVLLALIVPLGIVMYVLARKGRLWAKLFVAGIFVYLAFTYGLYALSISLNEVFLGYVALFSLCTFASVMGFHDMSRQLKSPPKAVWVKVIAVWLFLFVIGGYAAWLSEVIPAMMQDTIPESIQRTHLPVSVVHVLDMAFMLPLMMIGAIKLWKGHASGLVMSAMMLVFVLLTSIGVICMELWLGQVGLEMDMGKLISFPIMALISLVMTLFTYRKISSMSRNEEK
jgi:hypothetical protein